MKIIDLDEPQWSEWVKSRPECIQRLCAQLPPDRLYLLKTSGHRVTMVSYSENGTVTVAVLGKYNLVNFERQVFGIKPEDLEECDLPPEGEPLGVTMSEEEAEAFIAKQRAIVRKLN